MVHCRTLDVENSLENSIEDLETVVDAMFVAGPVELNTEVLHGLSRCIMAITSGILTQTLHD